MSKRTLSMAPFRVLNLFAAHPQLLMCGVDVMEELDMPSGTTYPILIQFEADGLLEPFKFEKQTPEALGRPRRLLYKITNAGKRLAGELLLDMGLQRRLPL